MVSTTLRRALGVLAGLLLAFGSACSPPTRALAAGDVAPDFTLMGSDGKSHHLADYHGKYVVLAWFPKANTGG